MPSRREREERDELAAAIRDLSARLAALESDVVPSDSEATNASDGSDEDLASVGHGAQPRDEIEVVAVAEAEAEGDAWPSLPSRAEGPAAAQFRRGEAQILGEPGDVIGLPGEGTGLRPAAYLPPAAREYSLEDVPQVQEGGALGTARRGHAYSAFLPARTAERRRQEEPRSARDRASLLGRTPPHLEAVTPATQLPPGSAVGPVPRQQETPIGTGLATRAMLDRGDREDGRDDRSISYFQRLVAPMLPPEFAGEGEEESLLTLKSAPVARLTDDEIDSKAAAWLDALDLYEAKVYAMAASRSRRSTPGPSDIIAFATARLTGRAASWWSGVLLHGLGRRGEALPEEACRNVATDLPAFKRLFAESWVRPVYRANLQQTLFEIDLAVCSDDLEALLDRHDAVAKALQRLNATMDSATRRVALQKACAMPGDVQNRLTQVFGDRAGEDAFASDSVSHAELLHALRNYAPARRRRQRKAKAETVKVLTHLRQSEATADAYLMMAVMSGPLTPAGAMFSFDCRKCKADFEAFVKPEQGCEVSCKHCSHSFACNGKRLLERGAPPRAPTGRGKPGPTGKSNFARHQELTRLAVNAIIASDHEGLLSVAQDLMAAGKAPHTGSGTELPATDDADELTDDDEGDPDF